MAVVPRPAVSAVRTNPDFDIDQKGPKAELPPRPRGKAHSTSKRYRPGSLRSLASPIEHPREVPAVPPAKFGGALAPQVSSHSPYPVWERLS